MDEKLYRGEACSPGLSENETGGSAHALAITNREHVQISGVIAVDNFDDEEVAIETELGLLTIRGEELHIKQLDLETGRFEVTGYVNAIQYAAPRPRATRPARSRGFLERLLR